MYISNSDFSLELKIHGSNSLQEVSTHTPLTEMQQFEYKIALLTPMIDSLWCSHLRETHHQSPTDLVTDDFGSLIASNLKISPINMVSKIYLKSSTPFYLHGHHHFASGI